MKTFEDAIAQVMEDDACSRLDAMSRARERHPTLYEKYQSEGEALAKAARDRIDKMVPRVDYTAVARFRGLVTELQIRDRLTPMNAMRLARQRYPAEFQAAYQNAE